MEADDPTMYALMAKSTARTIAEQNWQEAQRQMRATTAQSEQLPAEQPIPDLSSFLATPENPNPTPNGPLAGQIALKRALLKRVPKIREYSGAFKDDAAREYLLDCERFFYETEQLAEATLDDKLKVVYAQGALGGKAMKAWRSHQQRISSTYGDEISTWKQYREWILREFSEYLGPEKRWDRFVELKQGAKQPFAEYAMDLQQAAADTDQEISEGILIQYLRKGAKVELQKKWAEDGTRPKALRDIVERFIQYEQGSTIAHYYGRKARDADGDVKMAMNGMQSTKEPSNPPSTRGPGQARGRGNGRGRGSRNQPRGGRDTCYNCGGRGYFSQNCPSPPKQESGNDRKPKNGYGQTN
jgi:hypothetical protein